MKITSPQGKIIVVGDELGKDDRFKFYQCQVDTDSVCILKIARQVGFNGLLDREAYILAIMAEEAAALEIEFKKAETSNKFLNYHYFFPQLVETFISPEQENSRISILSFAHVAESLNKLSPISHLLSRENVRVDPRSSAWILGKLLKLLGFAHDQGIAVGNLDGGNILINREQHYVLIVDWTKAVMTNGELSTLTKTNEISSVALETTLILGGDPVTGKLPKSNQLEDSRYENFIKLLAQGSSGLDAFEAHRRFYSLIRSIWPTEFHSFTTHSLT